MYSDIGPSYRALPFPFISVPTNRSDTLLDITQHLEVDTNQYTTKIKPVYAIRSGWPMFQSLMFKTCRL
jgi:hypothetical protein